MTLAKALRGLLAAGLILALAAPAAADSNEPEPVPLVSVAVEDEEELVALVAAGLDVVDVDEVNLEVQVLLWDFERAYLAEHGLEYVVLEENLNQFPESPGFQPFSTERTDYRHLEDYYDELEQIVEQYPEITRLETIGYSIQDRPIIALEIAEAPGQDDGRPEHVHMALHHAREWPSGELAMDLAWYLVDNYGSDDRVTDIVDGVRTYIIPVQNPDGFNYSRTTVPLHRKNMNPAGTVDLNRNYAYMWGGPGSSGNSNSQTYRGTAPFSEPETQAIRDFYADKHLVTTITGHTHGGWWLFPWGHKTANPPDQELYDLAEASVQWSNYVDGPTAQVLYIASGDTTDWAYGSYRSLAFTPEYGTTGSFHPPYQGTPFPGLVTDALGDVEGRYMTGSVSTGGESGILVDCGLALAPTDCPEEVEGNIALIERGEDTFANKALNAVERGAVAAVIYNNTSGHINGTLGGVSVPVPVIGIPEADGLNLLDAMDDGPVEATLDTVMAHSYQDLWDVQLPAFLLNIEAAAEHAARLTGTVTDATSGAGLDAELELGLERQAFTNFGSWESYAHESSISTSEDGAFDWSVLPSAQPELETPPYALTATAPNYYPADVEVELATYGQEEKVDLALQPLAQVLEPYEQRRVQANATLPFRFETYAPDGTPTDVDGLSVTVSQDGVEIVEYLPGNGASAVRETDEPGRYIVNVNTRALGLAAGEYEIVVAFDHDGDTHSYSVPLEVTGR